MTPFSSELPTDENVRYEHVDALTVNVYIEGAVDTTVRKSHPAVRQMIERDRAQIDELLARIKREQEELNASKRPPVEPEEPPQA